MEVDADDEGMAIGRYLRIKVLVDVHKPLLRGITMEDDTGGKKFWCPFEYEFLPNFCYACGKLGHVDRICDESNWRGKNKPYGELMRVLPVRCRFIGETRSRRSDGGSSDGYIQQKSSGGSRINSENSMSLRLLLHIMKR